MFEKLSLQHELTGEFPDKYPQKIQEKLLIKFDGGVQQMVEV